MKRCVSILLALAMLLTLAACGGKSGADAADANKLVIWHDKEDAVVQALQDYLAKAAPDLEITFEKKTSLTDSLKLVGNDPSAAPDMFIFAHDKIGVFAEMGILSPISDFVDSAALEDLLPMTLDAATYKDTLYQLPLYFETLLFMYNQRYMLPDNVPATTDELLSYMQANTGTASWSSTAPPTTAPRGYTASEAPSSTRPERPSPTPTQ